MSVATGRPPRHLRTALGQIVNFIYTLQGESAGAQAFSSFDTQAPWLSEEIAQPCRFIKQRVDSHRELTPPDALFMLERAVEA